MLGKARVVDDPGLDRGDGLMAACKSGRLKAVQKMLADDIADYAI
jgi:hypothetical protein